MARSSAATVDAYLAELEPARAGEIAKVRDLINVALPAGYAERMAWGMIAWEVPLEVSGRTYNRQPLVYAALAAQRNYNALYLNCVHVSAKRTEQFKRAWAASGRKLDMGKSCIRFQRFDDLAADVVRAEIATASPEQFAESYAESRS